MTKKRIVFVFRDMGTGGSQKIEAFVANTLLEAGYDVVALNMSSTECSVNIDKDIPIVNVLYDEVEKCSNKIKKIILKAKYLLSFRHTIKSLSPDIVCSFLSDVVRITVLATKGMNVPVVGSERGDPYTFSDKQFARYKEAYGKCAGAVFQIPDVKEKYGLPSSVKQEVIPNPCIPRHNSFSIRDGSTTKTIIAAGRLTRQKRFDLLIDAFAEVIKKHPEYKLVIFGDGPLYSDLQKQVEELNIASNVNLAGDVDDVFATMPNADFFVLSSDFEGIPNVLMEAMAIGMPCVSTDCSPGGAKMLLNNGDRGLLVPKGDKDGLAEAIVSYIESPELRVEHSKKVLNVLLEYEEKKIKEQWVVFFEQVK